MPTSPTPDGGRAGEETPRPMTLYRLHGCPYCERIVRWLEGHGIEYRSVFVAGEHSRRDEVARVSGTRAVPLLIDPATGVTMPESGNILEYLVRTYGEEGDTAAFDELAVTEFDDSDHPTVGETAPAFTRPLVTDESWSNVALSDLVDDAGSVLLVFYPLNWGGKSMFWWKEIQRRGWGGDDLSVVGVGIGQPFDHQRFIEGRELPYPLYSDPGNGVAEAYDVVHELDGMEGIAEPRPSTFLVGADRMVEHVWVADEWPETPPYDEIEAALPAGSSE
ncbi:redoxin domain-containing protein [Halorubrum sp. F4]|uniref:redoxin domain-containing protein n=1 Tax=Halorubrum sp. F4 TaxID=2989715 RepID=UPI0034E095F8